MAHTIAHAKVILSMLSALALVPACTTPTPEAQAPNAVSPARVAGIEETVAAFKSKDPELQRLFEQSAGYVVMPTIGEGAYVVGGGYGVGEAFEKGRYLGRVTLTELSLGAQLGGQSYSELLFFEKLADLRRLQQGSFEFGAEVTAIAADHGAAKNATFNDGVVAFVLPKAGLMASASVNGQRLRFSAR